jgi:malate synthase
VVSAADLLNAKSTPGEVSEAGLRNNVSVGIQYLEAWLRGNGAVAIFNLMEDAATAEISRSQVWQWVHNGVATAEGTPITAEYVRALETEELAKVRETIGEEAYARGRYDEARELFDSVALADDFVDFLTLPAYERLP